MKFSICSILLFCAGLFAGEKPTAGDPLEWTPPKTRPVFPALPPETPELKARFEIAIRESEDYTKEVKSWPDNCAQIGNVLKDSQFAKLGLKIGDIITKFDDTVVVEGAVSKFRKEGVVQKATMWRFGKGYWTVDFEPGKLGGSTLGYNLPHLRDLGAIAPNPKWDVHIAAFRKLFQMDPALAEIALRRAIATGFPQDARTDGWFAEMALNQLHYARAMDFAWLSMQKTEPSEEVGSSFISAALAMGRYPAALQVSERMKSFSAKLKAPLSEIVGTLKALPKAGHALQLPMKQADALLKDDLIPRLALVDGKQSDSLAKVRELFFRVTINCFWKTLLRPEARNVLMRQKFIISPNQGGPRAYSNCYQIDFRPAGTPDRGYSSEFFFRVVVQPPKFIIRTGMGLYFSIEDWNFFKNPDQVHELAIAIVGERAEVIADKRSLGEFYLGRGGEKPMHWALQSVGMDAAIRETEYCELLDEKQYRANVESAGVKTVFPDTLTRLHNAAASGLTREAGILLDMGADVNARDVNQQTPLHHAVRFDHLETAKLLQAKGAVVDLHAAAGLGDLDAVKRLLATPAIPKDVPQNWTPLHGAAVVGSVDVIKLLIENKAVVDAKTPGRDATPLMWAARYGRKDAVDALIAGTANRSFQDKQKRRPADYARWGSFDDLSRYIDTGNAAAPAIRPPRPPEEF